MHILITGAAGMIGRKLTDRLIVDRALGGQPIEKLTLIDIIAPARPAGFSDHIKTRAADLNEPGVAAKAVSERPDVISISPAWCPARPSSTWTRATASISTARARCSRRSGRPATATSRAWCSPRRWRCSARRSRTRFPTTSI